MARTALDREALVGIINGAAGLAAFDLGDGSTPGLERAAHPEPQVILMDIGRDAAVSFAAGLRERSPGTHILAMQRAGSLEDLRFLAREGVTGFVTPDSGTQGLIRGIRTLIATGWNYPPDLLARLPAAVRERLAEGRTPGSVLFHLSAREVEIIQCMAEGLSNKEVAAVLHIGLGTVKTHVHRLLRKLGVPHRSAAVDRVRGTDWKLLQGRRGAMQTRTHRPGK